MITPSRLWREPAPYRPNANLCLFKVLGRTPKRPNWQWQLGRSRSNTAVESFSDRNETFRDLDQLGVCTRGYERATGSAAGFNEVKYSRSKKLNLVLKLRFDRECGEFCHNHIPKSALNRSSDTK